MFNLLAVDLQQAFANAETWIAAGVAFLTTTSLGGLIMAILMRIFTKKVNNQTNVSTTQIEKTAQLASQKTAQNMIGKSFNVNIKAEVDKAVQAEMKPIRENAEFAAVAAKNAEIASAHVLLAQSRSRLLTKEEKESLQLIAKKVLAHADGDVISPVVVEFTSAEETNADAEGLKASEDNSSLVSFDDVE